MSKNLKIGLNTIIDDTKGETQTEIHFSLQNELIRISSRSLASGSGAGRGESEMWGGCSQPTVR